MSYLFKNDLINIQIEPHNIPWVKIFVNRDVKELHQCTTQERLAIFDTIDIVERFMLEFYKPYNIYKINIASFGNFVPQVHWHIMGRFQNDEYFPQSVWGIKQRDWTLDLPSIDIFTKQLCYRLHNQTK